MAKPAVFDSRGARVGLGAKIGEGGEGTIYQAEIVGKWVAKIYRAPLPAEKVAKLEAMAGCRTDRLLAIAAWPIDTLHGAPGGPVQGFLMPRGEGRDIHLLYSPKSRAIHFPNATWPFLLHAAANLARAFAVVHEHGDVVGDVNQGNSLVSERATVTLIDCDSFQIHAGERTFPCGVGTELFLAPELQGQPLGRVLRTRDHDAFSLAVLVFHLLFLGRHPFAGRYLGSGEMPIERAIREHRFAYGAAARGLQMEPPPSSLALRAVSPEVQALFERAFLAPPVSAAEGAGRPAPALWVEALESLSRRLAICTLWPAHRYFRELPRCPWCEIEEHVGIALFSLYVLPAPAARAGAFDVHFVWSQIAAIPAPPRLPPPDPAAILRRASARARHAGWGRVAQLAVAFVVLAAGCYLSRNDESFAGFLVTGLAALLVLPKRSGPVYLQIQREVAVAQREWMQAAEEWRRGASDELFEAARQRLGAAKEEHLALPATRKRRLDQLRADLRAGQLRRFLERHRVEASGLRHIGPTRVATLRSYGIETAADVTRSAVLRVHGCGPLLTARLVGWRRVLEARFVFDPSQGIDPADVAEVERQTEARRLDLERELAGGAAALAQLGPRLEARRRALLPQLEAAAERLAQVQADLGFLRRCGFR